MERVYPFNGGARTARYLYYRTFPGLRLFSTTFRTLRILSLTAGRGETKVGTELLPPAPTSPPGLRLTLLAAVLLGARAVGARADGCLGAAPDDLAAAEPVGLGGVASSINVANKLTPGLPFSGRFSLAFNNINYTCLQATHALSVLTAIFPGGPRLAGTRTFPFWILSKLRMVEMVLVVTTIEL